MSFMKYYATFNKPAEGYGKTTLKWEDVFKKAEELRKLNKKGYRWTSADGVLRKVLFDKGRRACPTGSDFTYCCAFTLNAICWALEKDEEFTPMLADDKKLPFDFYRYVFICSGKEDFKGGVARAVTKYNLGYAVKPEEMQKGDVAQVWWSTGGGHSVFIWDVCKDKDDKVQAFQLLSSNGWTRTKLKDPKTKEMKPLVPAKYGGAGVSVSMMTRVWSVELLQKQGDGSMNVLKDPYLIGQEDFYKEKATWYTWLPKSKLDMTRFEKPPYSIKSRIGKLYVARFWPPEEKEEENAPPLPEKEEEDYAFHSSVQPVEVEPEELEKDENKVKEDKKSVVTPERHPDADKHKDDKGNIPKTFDATDKPLTTLKGVQERLKILYDEGHIEKDPGKADGDIGPKTKGAVEDFQKNFNVQPVDGIPGPITREALRKVYADVVSGKILSKKEKEKEEPPPPDSKITSVRWSNVSSNPEEQQKIIITTTKDMDGDLLKVKIVNKDDDRVLVEEEHNVGVNKLIMTLRVNQLVNRVEKLVEGAANFIVKVTGKTKDGSEVKGETEAPLNVRGGSGLKINWDFIRKQEGYKLKGYVPKDSSGKVLGKSGVTIATGFDIGQRDANQIKKMGFKESLEKKLLPYAGLKGDQAVQKLASEPLNVSSAEGKQIDKIVKGKYARIVARDYNKNSSKKFEGLPAQAQTVIASVSFQYGTLKKAAPNFWGQVTKQDWKDAKKNLRSFTSKKYTSGRHKGKMLYYLRREAEASLLDQIA